MQKHTVIANVDATSNAMYSHTHTHKNNLAFCTYFGIDAPKTKKKAYMYADVLLLNFCTYVCTYDSCILFFLWLNTYIDANHFYIWMYDYVFFF